MSFNLCGNIMYRVAFIVFFANLIFIFYTQYLEFKFYLEQQDFNLSDMNTLPNKNTIDTWIEHIRYDVFNVEYNFSRSYNNETNNRKLYKSVKYVNFLERSYLSYNFTKILSSRQPVVIINSSVLTWSALKWDLWNMSINSWRYLENVLSISIKNESYCDRVISANDILYVHNQIGNNLHNSISHQKQISILPNKLASVITKPVVIQSLLFIDFLYSISNNQLLHRYFYSTDYKRIENELQLQHDTNWGLFRIKDNTSVVDDLFRAKTTKAMHKRKDLENANMATTQKVNNNGTHIIDDFGSINPLLNMFYPGIALQGRYSTYHTMRIQIKGKTRYHLIPIYYGDNLNKDTVALFPSVHKCAYQSQVSLYEIFHDTNKSNVIQSVLLHPGEVLYIPPYWLVYTEAVSLSLSVDVLSFSKEQDALLPAFHMSLPFKREHIQTKAQRIVSSQVFLVHILSRIDGIKSIFKYSRRLYEARYKSLYPENGLFLQQNKFICLRDDSEQYNSIINSLDKIKIANAASFVAQQLNSYMGDNVKQFSLRRQSNSVKWTWLDDYVEQIASWAMGDATKAVLFIRECLYMDSVLRIVEEVLGPEKVVLNPS